MFCASRPPPRLIGGFFLKCFDVFFNVLSFLVPGCWSESLRNVVAIILTEPFCLAMEFSRIFHSFPEFWNFEKSKILKNRWFLTIWAKTEPAIHLLRSNYAYRQLLRWIGQNYIYIYIYFFFDGFRILLNRSYIILNGFQRI